MTARSFAGVIAGLATLVTAVGVASGVAATAAPTTTITTVAAPPSSTVPVTTAGPPTPTSAPVTAGTSVATTTTIPPTTTTPPTTTLPPVDLLAGVPWIQRTFASPCSDGAVQMIGGSAVDGASLAVLDDVLPLEPFAGVAVAFLSCHAARGTTTETTAVLVKVDRSGSVASVHEQPLGGDGRVVAVQLPAFMVEAPEGAPADGSCCAPLVRRRSYNVALDGFHVTADRQISAFLQTVARPAVGGDGDLVRASIPAPALCYDWDNVYLGPQDPGDEPPAVSAPSAELQTIRLAIIHLTGRWITPSSFMTREMSDVVMDYQASRGITADGLIGDETTRALRADLGCGADGSFDQVLPTVLGPRRFASIADLLVATQRFAESGTTGNTSLDGLLAAAGWDAVNSMFLGCYRWESPSTGMSCSWSGRTPLQLIGLVDDPGAAEISTFSILYARSASAG